MQYENIARILRHIAAIL